ncbi:DUF998 domain-containing protein [Paenibacillus sp. LMG 31456]|uniref:DUF998 domain-containing protein n=1 Tax=Paenibacillus foliorum TaxID=2654974 RepID=A0A972GRM0_9BACL|nr:DUF998 domain-containing protein [Paenibacillus foliorum]NOU92928.1 DUF998 domain-containing protein [Paenibacillus foliorum]
MKQASAKTNYFNGIRKLLMGGAISAPFFYAIVLVQVFTRTGFDIKRHAISSLTLGDLGWIQRTDFIVTGLFAVLAAFGIRSLLRGGVGSTWGSLLIGIYGFGMATAGIFRPDPGLGFPSGTPEGMPASMSDEAALHSAAFFMSFICLIAACFIFARRFAEQGKRVWSVYCMASGIVPPLLIILGFSVISWIGVIMACSGIIAFGFVSVIATHLRAEAAFRLRESKI